MVNPLYDAIASHTDKLRVNTFTAIPAIVKAYDSKEQTISAQPVMLEPSKDGSSMEMPVIEDIPVMFYGSGGGCLTFPVSIDDEVLLIFSARNFDTWWDSSTPNQLSTSNRYHSISDAIAILGLKSKGNSVEANEEDVELSFMDNKIVLKADGTIEVEVKDTFSVTNSQEELVSVLSDALGIIAASTVNTMYGPSPLINTADILEVKARLDTFKK